MLSKDELLRKTNNGLDVFRHYIAGEWRVGRNFLNPMYADRRASCNIYFDRRNGSYRMKDFGNDAYSGDCFDIVGKMKGFLNCSNPKDFVEILQTINRDMCLGLDEESDTSFIIDVQPHPVRDTGFVQKQIHDDDVLHKPDRVLKMQSKAIRTPETNPYQPETPKKGKPYSAQQQLFSSKELAFWSQYGITAETLKTYQVASLQQFKSENSEGKSYMFHSTANEPIFGYMGKRHIKIYRPFSDVRFLYGGILSDNYCFGLEQLPAKGDTLFVTGGEKDVLSMTAKGFYAICFNSETSHIPKSVIKKLSYRFKHIVLLYDTDKTGLEASEKQWQHLSEIDVKRFVLPLAGTKDEKDISDYFRMGNSRENFISLFIEFLDNIYSETMAILKPCEIDYTNPPTASESVVSVNDVPLGAYGNLLGITGGEGTGKSNFAGSLIAGSIGMVDVLIDTLGVTVQRNAMNKAVLLYDTEQSEAQLYKNISAILRRGKTDAMPGNFKAYCLTSMSRKERMQAIVQSMDRYYYQFGGIQMVVIDGIADLVRCANDEAESVGVIDELYRLAGIYNTCIVCVLHFVPNGMKLRGHLGSELQRKSAAILSIERDDEPHISVIKTLKVRDGSPLDVPLIQFAWDKELSMHAYIGEKPKEEKEKRKENELINVARTVFSKQRFCTYVDLCEQIQAILDVKERTAKNYIRFMRDKEIILKDPSNAGYFIIGHINS